MYLKVQMLPCNAKHYMLVITIYIEHLLPRKKMQLMLLTHKDSFKKLTNLTPFHLNREITYTCNLVHVSMSM